MSSPRRANSPSCAARGGSGEVGLQQGQAGQAGSSSLSSLAEGKHREGGSGHE